MVPAALSSMTPTFTLYGERLSQSVQHAAAQVEGKAC